MSQNSVKLLSVHFVVIKRSQCEKKKKRKRENIILSTFHTHCYFTEVCVGMYSKFSNTGLKKIETENLISTS